MPHHMKHFWLLLVLIVAISITVVSCGKVTSSQTITSYTTMSMPQITSMLKTNFNISDPVFIFSDSTYILPTTAWVKGPFSETLKKFLFDYNVSQYQVDSNDCDDFAFYGRAMANILNRHNPNGKNHGIAVGAFSKLADMGINSHVLNFVIVADEDKKPKVLFYEPQTQQTTLVNTNSVVFWWVM